MAKQTIKASIFRYDPDKDKEPYFQDYEVEMDVEGSITVFELLKKIHRDYDGTLAFRTYRCYKGMCTTCVVKLNGKVVKSCATRVEPGSTIKIEPPGGGEIVRDLVVDFSKM